MANSTPTQNVAFVAQSTYAPAPVKVKFAKIATTADLSSTPGTLVSAVTGKKIRVLAYDIQAQVGATTPSVQFTSNTTALTGLMAVVATAAASNADVKQTPWGCFETASGEALKILGGNADNDFLGWLVYCEVDGNVNQ